LIDLSQKLSYALPIYLLLINLALFVTMGADKSFARRGMRRVPERTLFAMAMIGGSVGGILGMRVFHHKTLHNSFRIGFPLILALQLALGAYLVYCTVK
jgi:uncharacterized membrane protein YsdA (DUF1294 family)